MRLVTFEAGGSRRVGVMATDHEIIDVGAADPSLPADMLALVAGWKTFSARLQDAMKHGPRRQLAEISLKAPLPRPPRNIFCVGKNYHEHAKEFANSGFDATAKEVVPEAPVVFSKPPSAVIGPGEPIPSYLDPTASVDYEGELAVVVGAAPLSPRRSCRGLLYSDLQGKLLMC